jgi:hypothetical protein
VGGAAYRTDPEQDFCIGGEHKRVVNLELRDLLSVLDETEERLRRGELTQSC